MGVIVASLLLLLVSFVGAAWGAESGADPYSIAKDFGFPAFVALLVLIRLDSTLQKLLRSVELLTRSMIRHGVHVDDDDPGGKP